MTTGLLWQDLNVTVTRQRPTSTETRDGEQSQDWGKSQQEIQATIQAYIPRGGSGALISQPEGMTEAATHIMYCNFTVSARSKVPTDIQFGDRIVYNGVNYRVLLPTDDGGLNDHMKVLLTTMLPGASG